MEEIKRYPPEILKLDRIDGFIEQYRINLRHFKVMNKAYEMTEFQRAQYFEGSKFSNYESFRKVLMNTTH
jgi:hypothetical protein